MGNPDQAAAQTVSFADSVADAISKTTQNEDGKDVLPEGLDEGVTYAANAELRRRHTQGEYSKTKQSLSVKEAENEGLRKLVVPQLNLSVAQKEELEDLKNTDPDAWERKLNDYRSEARTTSDKDLEKISFSAAQTAEVERRKTVLGEFRTTNPELVLNDEVLANDIPPRIKNKLENGDTTFDEFLAEVKEYLVKGTVIGDANKAGGDPNLNDVGGGANASKDEVTSDMINSYKDEIY